MNRTFSILLLSAMVASLPAQPVALKSGTEKPEVSLVDLATVLRLAEAQSIDIQIAREKVKEAQANHTSAMTQFFPWLSPGVSYRRHDNLIQTVEGRFIEVHKQSYAPGATLGAQLELGDAIYKSLAARQQSREAGYALEARRQEVAFNAAQNYFTLLVAQAAVGIAEESMRLSTNFATQIKAAVSAGLTYQGDALRVQVQAERSHVSLRQAEEQRLTAAARLSQTLRLDPTLLLVAQDAELIPLALFETNLAVGSLVARAVSARPEVKQSRAALAAADHARQGAVYGPIIPTVGAQVFAGGLGGDSNAGASRFGEQEDYFVGVSWKIGPGGLFDRGRTRAAEARLKSAELSTIKLDDEISRQVVEAYIRVQSLRDQIDSAKRVLSSADESLRLAQLRNEFSVGVVLENIQAEQDLTRARFDYLKTIADYNAAQYYLSRAVGGL